MSEKQYIIVCVDRTKASHAAITLLRADSSGHCWEVDAAGRYGEAVIMSKLGYYNNGLRTMAVPAEVVEQMAQKVLYDYGESAFCLPNSAATWDALLGSVVAPTASEPRPLYLGGHYPLKIA